MFKFCYRGYGCGTRPPNHDTSVCLLSGFSVLGITCLLGGFSVLGYNDWRLFA